MFPPPPLLSYSHDGSRPDLPRHDEPPGPPLGPLPPPLHRLARQPPRGRAWEVPHGPAPPHPVPIAPNPIIFIYFLSGLLARATATRRSRTANPHFLSVGPPFAPGSSSDDDHSTPQGVSSSPTHGACAATTSLPFSSPPLPLSSSMSLPIPTSSGTTTRGGPFGSEIRPCSSMKQVVGVCEEMECNKVE